MIVLHKPAVTVLIIWVNFTVYQLFCSCNAFNIKKRDINIHKMCHSMIKKNWNSIGTAVLDH